MGASLGRRPRVLATCVAVLAVLLFLTAGTAAWFSYDLTAGLPDKTELRTVGDMAQATTIHDSEDKPVFTLFKEQRIEIPIEKISPHLIKAVIAVEDQRFYDHSGVDTIRVVGAALRNIEAGRRAEGGSTITQQLARQSFLSRDKTYRRKIKEVILAAYLESLYSKDEILELYLNKVYFGEGLYGVEAASRGYFGKSASELAVDEAALLAGLIQSPSSYAPTVNRDRALARRSVVLGLMASSGAIDAPTAERLKKAPLKLVNGLEIKEDYGLYFKEHVRRELVERFGQQRVYQGGLRVYTTMDSGLQRAGEALLEKGLRDIEKRSGFDHASRGEAKLAEGQAPDYLQGALVSIDPASGHVLAMVGGRDFNESRFNRAVQAKRQSGSAFKPFVFATALEAGYSPATVITRLNEALLTDQGEWLPEDEHSSANSMTLRTALRTSSNRAAVQLLNSVGIQKAVSYSEKLHVGTPPSVPSLALGAGEVNLLSLTAAYGAFADHGVVREPVTIRRVEDSDGTVLYQAVGKAERAVSEATAFMMASMLSDVVNSGTGYRARQAGFTIPAAGKTGTTNDYVDAWFVGFTTKIVTGVWIGFDQPKTIVRGGYAGELAVPVWASFMKQATKGHKAEWFDRPDTVTAVNICRVSGKLPNGGCHSQQVATRDGYLETRSLVYTEYFRKGTQPGSVCPLHPSPSFFERMADAVGIETGTPVSAEAAGLPTPPPASTSGVVTPGAVPTPQADSPKADEPEKKKRGFWSRLFGRGGDDKNDKKKDPPKKDPKKPGGQ